MTIDQTTGTVRLGEAVIRPTTSRHDFLTSSIGFTVSKVIQNEVWETYQLQIDEDGSWIGLKLTFEGERLDSLGFTMGPPPVSWGDWSENAINDQAKLVEDFLHVTLGNPPYHFRWGKVSVVRDLRTGEGAGWIEYKK